MLALTSRSRAPDLFRMSYSLQGRRFPNLRPVAFRENLHIDCRQAPYIRKRTRDACVFLMVVSGSPADTVANLIEGATMQRIFLAFLNSMRALKYLAGHEKAVQQELVLFLLSLPAAYLLAPTWLAFLFMTGSILFLILVEVLNTGIEATCDAVSRDFHKEIQIAKDCGSLAVLISILFVVVVWGYILATTYLA